MEAFRVNCAYCRGQVGNQTELTSLTAMFQFLKIKPDDVLPTDEGEGQKNNEGMDNGDCKLPLCARCSQLADSFSGLNGEMEAIKAKMEVTLDEITGEIKKGQAKKGQCFFEGEASGKVGNEVVSKWNLMKQSALVKKMINSMEEVNVAEDESKANGEPFFGKVQEGEGQPRTLTQLKTERTRLSGGWREVTWNERVKVEYLTEDDPDEEVKVLSGVMKLRPEAEIQCQGMYSKRLTALDERLRRAAKLRRLVLQGGGYRPAIAWRKVLRPRNHGGIMGKRRNSGGRNGSGDGKRGKRSAGTIDGSKVRVT